MESKGIGHLDSLKPQVISSNTEIGKRMGKLGLAKRILTGSDDPSGRARATRTKAQGDSIETGRRNARAGYGMARAAGGSLDRLSATLGRMGELATRAANGTFSDEDRASLDAEFQGLADDLASLVQDASYGGVELFSGVAVELQVGADAGDTVTMELPGPGGDLGLDDLAAASLATLDGAGAGKQAVDAALAAVAEAQADLGGTMAALESSAQQSSAALESIARVESYLGDRDLADAGAQLLARQMRHHAAVAAAMHHGLDDTMVQKLLAA